MRREFTVDCQGHTAKVTAHTEDAGNTVEVCVKIDQDCWPLLLRSAGAGFRVELAGRGKLDLRPLNGELDECVEAAVRSFMNRYYDWRRPGGPAPGSGL